MAPLSYKAGIVFHLILVNLAAGWGEGRVDGEDRGEGEGGMGR